MVSSCAAPHLFRLSILAIATAMFLFGLTYSAQADIARPAQPKKATPVKIHWQPESEEQLRLVIPAAVVGRQGVGAVPQNTPLPTIIAGLALSLAVLLGGLWAFRRWMAAPLPAAVKVTAGASMVVAIVAVTWSVAQADFRPDPAVVPVERGDFNIEIKTTSGGAVQLYLSESQAKAIQEMVRARKR